MELTERHRNALTGLINIGFARTAASLSDLTGHRVRLGVPEVGLHSIRDLARALSGLAKKEVATVHQLFAGPVAGDALLLLGYDDALMLTHMLADKPATASRLDASTREVLTEVGNILLNACLEMFGNMLHAQVSFSVPSLHLESLDTVLRSLVIGREEPRYALVVHTTFRLRDDEVTGYLVIVPGIASLDYLIKETESWKERQ